MTARLRGDVVVIDVGGINRWSGGDELSPLILQMLEQGFRHYVLNLVRISYLDSSGLGGLIRSYATVSRRGGKLKLLHVHDRIRQLLQITRLASTFDVFTSEDEAVRSFGSHRARGNALPERVSSPTTGAV